MKILERVFRALSPKQQRELIARESRRSERAVAAKAYRAREPFASQAKDAAAAKRVQRGLRNLQAVYAGGMNGVAAA